MFLHKKQQLALKQIPHLFDLYIDQKIWYSTTHEN